MVAEYLLSEVVEFLLRVVALGFHLVEEVGLIHTLVEEELL